VLRRSPGSVPSAGAHYLRRRGSSSLYFGPNAPAGLESNWIPTMGKEPYVWLRLYGLEEAFWNKPFKMPDVELVN